MKVMTGEITLLWSVTNQTHRSNQYEIISLTPFHSKMGHSASQNYHLVEKDILCPLCLQVPPDKIFQCKNKHNFCEACTKKLKKCPVCKASLKHSKQKFRNEVLESALNSMRFTCLYKRYGCTEMSRRQDLKTHIATCEHAPVHLCKQLGFSRCNFPVTDSNIPEYIQHLQSAHEDDILFMNKLSPPTISPTGPQASSDKVWKKPILFDLSTPVGTEYVVVIPHVKTTETKDWDLWFTAVYLGKSKEEASKIYVELSKRSENMSEVPEAEWRQLVIPITDIAKSNKTKHLIKYRVHHEEINSKAFIKVDVRRKPDITALVEHKNSQTPTQSDASTTSGIPVQTNTSERSILATGTSTEDLTPPVISTEDILPPPDVFSTNSTRVSQSLVDRSFTAEDMISPEDFWMIDYLITFFSEQWVTGTIVLGSVAALWVIKSFVDTIFNI